MPPSPRPCCLLPAEKGFFSYDSFLALMGVSREKAQNQEHELRVAFRVFDKEGKGCILHRLGHAQEGPGRRGGSGAGAPRRPLSAGLRQVRAHERRGAPQGGGGRADDKGGDGTINYEGE